MALNLNREGVALDGDARNKRNENWGMIENETQGVQAQINQLVVDGDSSPEAAQARVSVDGTSYVNLKARLDAEKVETNQQLADKASKEELTNVLDGSPKGTYSTLAELQTTFPDGTEGVYIVAADGHIYSWDGAAWADRGLYQSQGIADGSVAVRNLETSIQQKILSLKDIVGDNNEKSVAGGTGYVVIDNNTLSKLVVTSGTYFGYLLTNHVSPSRKYLFACEAKDLGNVGGSSVKFREFENGTWGSESASHVLLENGSITDIVITDSPNVAITSYGMFCTVYGGNKNIEYTVKGFDVTGMDQASIDDIDWFNQESAVVIFSYMSEKSNRAVIAERVGESWYEDEPLTTIGDSITNHDRWQPVLINELKFGTHTKLGVDGSRVALRSTLGETHETNLVAMCTDARINAIPIDTKVILFMGGTNDFAQNIPLGELSLLNTDTDTYFGALNVMFNKMTLRAPNALIVSMSCILGRFTDNRFTDSTGYVNNVGLSTLDYGKANLEMGRLWGCKLIDNGLVGINQNNIMTKTSDGLHPTVATGQEMGLYMAKMMMNFEPLVV